MDFGAVRINGHHLGDPQLDSVLSVRGTGVIHDVVVVVVKAIDIFVAGFLKANEETPFLVELLHK